MKEICLWIYETNIHEIELMDELIQCVKYLINEWTHKAMNEKMDLYIIIF